MATVILTHGDCDGVCSGALALAANPGAKVFFTNPATILSDIGQAQGCRRLICSDLAINISTAGRLKGILDTLSKEMEVIYLDHHPLPPGFTAPWLTHDANACGALLVYQYFKPSLGRDMSRVAMYGAIGDYRDNNPIALDITGKWDKRSLYYEGGIVSQGIELVRRDHDFKRQTLASLAKNTLPSEMHELARRAQSAAWQEDEMRMRVEESVVPLNKLSYVMNPNGSISKAAIYARAYGNRPVGLSAEHIADKHIYEVSVRSLGGFDLNTILDKVASKYGGSGGGHPEAGGARIPEAEIKRFIEDLDAALGKL